MKKLMGKFLSGLYTELGESFFDHIPMGMVFVGQTGQILHANHTFCDFLGYSLRKMTAAF